MLNSVPPVGDLKGVARREAMAGCYPSSWLVIQRLYSWMAYEVVHSTLREVDLVNLTLFEVVVHRPRLIVVVESVLGE